MGLRFESLDDVLARHGATRSDGDIIRREMQLMLNTPRDTRDDLEFRANTSARLQEHLARSSINPDRIRADLKITGQDMLRSASRLTQGRDRGQLSASDARDYDALSRAADEVADFLQVLDEFAATRQVDHGGRHIDPSQSRGFDRDKMPLALTRGQSVAEWHRAFRPNEYQEERDQVDLGKWMRGILSGNWYDADIERRAASEGSASAGGYLVPTPLAARVIDNVRNVSRVFQAGAMTVPMESQTLKIAKLTGDPSASWRAEGSAVAESDATFGRVTLEARMISVISKATIEVVEDAPNLGQVALDAVTKSISTSIDYAALYGGGTAVSPAQPQGLKGSGATITHLAAHGSTPSSWAFVTQAINRLELKNYEPEQMAGIWSPRTEGTMDQLVDSTYQPLRLPPKVDRVRLYATNQVGTAFAVGTAGSVCSDLFVGDFSNMLVGVRTNGISIVPLRERYIDTGHYGWLTYWRGDVQFARTEAFEIVDAIKA